MGWCCSCEHATCPVGIRDTLGCAIEELEHGVWDDGCATLVCIVLGSDCDPCEWSDIAGLNEGSYFRLDVSGLSSDDWGNELALNLDG